MSLLIDLSRFSRARPIIFRFLEPIDFERAWELYLQFKDKNFSFTDCTNIDDSEFNGIVSVIS